jgi:hypothetical protein
MSSSSTISAIPSIFSFRRLPSLVGIVRRTRIRARCIDREDDDVRILMASRACVERQERERVRRRCKVQWKIQETHLDLGTLIRPDIEPNFRHSLLHHPHTDWSPGIRIYTFFSDQRCNLLPQISKLMVSLLFTYLKFTFC